MTRSDVIWAALLWVGMSLGLGVVMSGRMTWELGALFILGLVLGWKIMLDTRGRWWDR